MEESALKAEIKRDERGRLLPGHGLISPGRPEGKTLKEFAREFYMLKSEDEKRAYIEKVEEKRPGFAWEMAEGKAAQGIGIDPNLEPIELLVKVIRSDASINGNSTGV